MSLALPASLPSLCVADADQVALAPPDFVLDLAPNGEILSLIRQVGSFSLTCARHYAAELVDIVGWIHSRGVLHRCVCRSLPRSFDVSR